MSQTDRICIGAAGASAVSTPGGLSESTGLSALGFLLTQQDAAAASGHETCMPQQHTESFTGSVLLLSNMACNLFLVLVCSSHRAHDGWPAGATR